MRTVLRALLVTLCSVALLALPLLPDTDLGGIDVNERRVDLAFAEDGGGSWISSPVEGGDTIAGLTWDDPADAPEQAEVRVRDAEGWSDWAEVPTDDEHAPDPDSDEATQARGGTSPIIIEGADAVQFRVTDGDAPADLAADLVAVDDPDAVRRISERPGAADASPGRPAIHPRRDWGGDGCRSDEPVEYAQRAAALFVHHTAGHTSYSQSQVPGIIRAICSYHVNSRGWDDIGYNALIDRYGGIWEGRAGGIDKAVQGAHTGGFNEFSTGVAMIGHHDQQGVTTAAQDALVRYGAWKLDIHNLNPLSRATITSNGSSKWAEGRQVTFDTVSGHRDASSTACPGRYCYSLLDQFAQRMDAIGGFRVFGGWPNQSTVQLQRDGTWTHPRFSFSFSDRASWTFTLRDPDGDVVFTRSGTGSAPVTIEWDAEVGGRTAPKGVYSATVTARDAATREAARNAVHDVVLGSAVGQFRDVSRGHVFGSEIAWLARREITKGCNPPTNTRFCPDDVVTRGQMAAFLVRALDLPPGTRGRFLDVPSDHVFHDDINSLAEAGITVGCNSPARTRYCPDDPVRREQMAAFLARALDLRDASHPGFRDVVPGSTFDRHVRRLATAGVTKGCNPPANNLFCPRDPVTRGQMAAFLQRGLTL